MYRLIGDNHVLDGLPYSAQVFLRALDSVRRDLARDAGLTGGELSALGRIAEESEIALPNLAEYLELAETAAGDVVAALAARDLVAATTTGAVTTLDLTPAGHVLMEKVYLDFQASINEAASSLDDERLYAFDSSLLKMARKLDAAATAPSAG